MEDFCFVTRVVIRVSLLKVCGGDHWNMKLQVCELIFMNEKGSEPITRGMRHIDVLYILRTFAKPSLCMRAVLSTQKTSNVLSLNTLSSASATADASLGEASAFGLLALAAVACFATGLGL